MSDEWPKPCVSNMHFADQFPKTLKRAGVIKLTGQALGETRGHPDVYNVKWDGLRATWRLHKSFFEFVPPPPAA